MKKILYIASMLPLPGLLLFVGLKQYGGIGVFVAILNFFITGTLFLLFGWGIVKLFVHDSHEDSSEESQATSEARNKE